MPVHVTFHAVLPTFEAPGGALLPVLGPKLGDRETIDVGDVDHTEAADRACIARIYATEACVIDIGQDAVADAATGEIWQEGKDDVRYVPAGTRVSVIAAA